MYTQVCLLNATRILAGFEKIVRTSLKSPPEDSEFNLFTPGDLEEDVLMPESLVKPPHGLSLDMVVANCNPFPVHLKKGTVLGRVEPAVLANEEEIVGDTGAEGSPAQKKKPMLLPCQSRAHRIDRDCGSW